MPTVADVTRFLDRFAPSALAADWDNVGLLLGEPDAELTGVLTCLTLTPEVAEEAVEAKAGLVVSHHPILFRAAKRLTTRTAEGRIIWQLARAGVAVHSPHTAFDNTTGGINDALAGRLGLEEIRALRYRPGSRSCKVVVFVPANDMQAVADAMFAAGAGVIGEYTQCSFRSSGTGTFLGSEASNPTLGQRGRREEVAEWRLEVLCPESVVPKVVGAMRRAHSYEEPAFDIVPLQPQSVGEGRIGNLPSPAPLAEVVRGLKHSLSVPVIPVVGAPDRPVRRIAIACGAAGEYLADAVREGADAFLTGEMRFHDYLAAQAQGIALLLPGHYATERLGADILADRIRGQWPDLRVSASQREADPVTWL